MSRKKSGSAKYLRKKLSELHDRSFIINEKTAFSVKEEYKTLRTNIQLSIPSEGCRVIGITSALPFEGKSINCLNLAITFSRLEARVLIIDCDLRLPSQGRLLGMDAVPGISNVLAGMNTIEEAIQKTEYPNVEVLLSGNIPPNPTELLGSKNMSMILEVLSQEYDYIFIDLPPVNIVSDTMIMSKNLSGLLIVVRSASSRRDSVVEAISRLELAKANIIGVLFTCAANKKLNGGRYRKYDK